ncbi:hypothetical protein B0H10DRAFT_2210910 [Mycena sp. CBHHK59/15]|nr:hypothetical protein B0H10DRAFT_2210910 [Mycena sp. CBHHK59/15]
MPRTPAVRTVQGSPAGAPPVGVALALLLLEFAGAVDDGKEYLSATPSARRRSHHDTQHARQRCMRVNPTATPAGVALTRALQADLAGAVDDGTEDPDCDEGGEAVGMNDGKECDIGVPAAAQNFSRSASAEATWSVHAVFS